MSDLESRLKAAQEKKQELEAKREARQTEKAEAKAVADLEREVKELEAVDRAESELGDQGVDWESVQTPDGIVILRRVHSAIFRKFSDSEKKNHQELDKLANAGLFYPEKGDFAILADKFPAIHLMCADAICRLAGARAEASAKK